MFVDKPTAERIEHAEALMMRDLVGELVGTARAPAAFVTALGAGTATFVRPASPFNKVIGAGLDGPIDGRLLDVIEADFRRNHEPVRHELSTLADPQTFAQLAERGYRLLGFENVLVRSLAALPPAPVTDIAVERVTADTLAAFRSVQVDASATPDDTGVVLDTFTRDVIATVVEDSLLASCPWRYLAARNGEPAGAASMSLHDGIAVLAGSGTLAPQRGGGVHRALIARRLADAREAGAQLAIVTTALGTRSQANMMKVGFSLAYPRAVLVLAS